MAALDFDPKYRIELKIELDKLKTRQQEMLDGLGQVPLDRKSLHDFWRDYSMLGHKIEVVENRLKPPSYSPGRMKRDTAHDFVFANNKEKPNGS